MTGCLDVAVVTVADGHALVRQEARRLPRGSIAQVLDAMRSFLRVTYPTGLMAAYLSTTLPDVATGCTAAIPR